MSFQLINYADRISDHGSAVRELNNFAGSLNSLFSQGLIVPSFTPIPLLTTILSDGQSIADALNTLINKANTLIQTASAGSPLLYPALLNRLPATDGTDIKACINAVILQMNKNFLNASGLTPVTIFSDTLGGDGGPANGVGFRTIIPVAHLVAAPGATKIIVNLSVGGPTVAGSQLQAWVGEWVGSGDAWAFDGNQVQLTWGGNATFAVAGGAQTFASDAIPFAYCAAKNLIVGVDSLGPAWVETFGTDTFSLTSYYKFGGFGGSNDPSAGGTSGQSNPYTTSITMQ